MSRYDWPRNNSLRNDPAAFKSRFMGGGSGSADYFARVQKFNRNLYTPTDTRPRVELPRMLPLSVSRASAGWQTTDDAGLSRIAARYSPNPAAALANIASRPSLVSPSGAAGPAGEAGITAPVASSAVDTAPRAQMPAEGPAKNTLQQWMDEGGTKRSWSKAGVAMGLRPRIDARATPSPRNSTASADIRASWGMPKLPY